MKLAILGVVGVSWEIYEILDGTTNIHLTADQIDTFKDLVMDFIGGSFYMLMENFKQSRQKVSSILASSETN